MPRGCGGGPKARAEAGGAPWNSDAIRCEAGGRPGPEARRTGAPWKRAAGGRPGGGAPLARGRARRTAMELDLRARLVAATVPTHRGGLISPRDVSTTVRAPAGRHSQPCSRSP
jgi:hypothetical protein